MRKNDGYVYHRPSRTYGTKHDHQTVKPGKSWSWAACRSPECPSIRSRTWLYETVNTTWPPFLTWIVLAEALALHLKMVGPVLLGDHGSSIPPFIETTIAFGVKSCVKSLAANVPLATV